jgi:hypothetical protein
MKNKKFVLELKPTQFAVGMMEVDEKIKLVSKFNKRQRRNFLEKTPVPVVRGPDGSLYIVDHHHFLCVCYHVGIKKVKVNLVHDHHGRSMSHTQFWRWMKKTRNTYPYCQFGEGPRKEYYLPKDIRGLADDPYRSLAWFVRKAGAFKNSEKNFAEFKWANFFRSKHLLDRNGLAGLEQALAKAVALAQSPEARLLPGFGKLNLTQQKKVQTKAKVKAKIAQKPVRAE